MDLDAFVDAHVHTAADFEENYRAVKTKRREAEKLPETVKVNEYVRKVCGPTDERPLAEGYHQIRQYRIHVDIVRPKEFRWLFNRSTNPRSTCFSNLLYCM